MSERNEKFLLQFKQFSWLLVLNDVRKALIKVDVDDEDPEVVESLLESRDDLLMQLNQCADALIAGDKDSFLCEIEDVLVGIEELFEERDEQLPDFTGDSDDSYDQWPTKYFIQLSQNSVLDVDYHGPSMRKQYQARRDAAESALKDVRDILGFDIYLMMEGTVDENRLEATVMIAPNSVVFDHEAWVHLEPADQIEELTGPLHAGAELWEFGGAYDSYDGSEWACDDSGDVYRVFMQPVTTIETVVLEG